MDHRYSTWRRHRASALRLGWYPPLPVHVVIGTWKRRPCFALDEAARPVFDCLAQHERTLAVALMPDHLHWLLTDATDLPEAIGRMKSFTTTLARSSARDGKVWQRGYFDTLIADRNYCREVARYIVHNPVRSGLATSASEYPWVFLSRELGGRGGLDS